MDRMSCENCGAPITGDTCPYCGTRHELPIQTMALGKTVSIRFEHQGMLYEMDVSIEHFAMDDVGDEVSFYTYDGPVFTHSRPDYRVSISGRAVPSVKHGRECLWAVRELEPSEMTC